MSSLTRIAVDRPVTTLMASVMIIILGGVALRGLTVDLMPDMSYPTVSVNTIYRGAGPEEIETLITRPLEQVLSSVNGVDRLSSGSMEGGSTIRVQFNWGVDLDVAIADMREAIQKTRNLLPEAIEEPYIRRYDVADSPILYLGLTSTELDAMALGQLAEQTILPRLERVDGVARVGIRGAPRREIQVDLDRAKIEALDLGVNEVVAAVARDNVNLPAGNLDQGHLRLLVRSRGEFTSLEDISNTVVRQVNGALVRISDIATVSDGEEERTQATRVDGEPGLMVYVHKQSDANTVEVSDRVREAVDRLNASLTNARMSVRMDQSDFIRESIANVRTSAILGMVLAVGVLVIFLRSFRSTLVIAVSMPLSVLATFVLIYFQGFTLNMVSFGGLALGVGMLVDNSIVVLESIFRRREDGQDARTAAIEGTSEVANAIVASTATTLIVFLPLLFVQGITGLLLQQLAWVVSFSLICSLLASLTLTPVLAAWWLSARERQETSLSDGRRARRFASMAGAKLVAGFHATNRSMLSGLEWVYERVLRFSLRHAAAIAFLMFLALTATVGLTPLIGTEFLPKADEGRLHVDADMAAGIQLPTLERQAVLIEQTLQRQVPEAVTIATFIGDDADEGDEWNESRYYVDLLPRDERERGVEEIRKEVEQAIAGIPGMETRVQASSGMPLYRMLRHAGAGGGLEVEIRGHDLRTSEELAEAVAALMHEIPGLVNIEAVKDDRRPELTARVDRNKASLLGVSVADVGQVLETTVRGTIATTYRDRGDEFNVLVRLRESDRDALADLAQVGVTTPLGQVVPLSNLVNFEPGTAPVRINRLDQQRFVVVSADVEDRSLGEVVSDLQEQLSGLPVPDETTLHIGGDWEQQQESFNALRIGFVLAIVFMYMVMAAQFESLRDPLLILVTIPLGAIGVILALVLTGTTLNVQSFIGIVVLAGIVVNNAIVLVDYNNYLKRHEPDLSPRERIVRASVRRFRPILMTTLTTVLGMLPIAFGLGEGGELQAPMARVVIGGLLSGTLITLLAIPLLAQAVERRAINAVDESTSPPPPPHRKRPRGEPALAGR